MTDLKGAAVGAAMTGLQLGQTFTGGALGLAPEQAALAPVAEDTAIVEQLAETPHGFSFEDGLAALAEHSADPENQAEQLVEQQVERDAEALAEIEAPEAPDTPMDLDGDGFLDLSANVVEVGLDDGAFDMGAFDGGGFDGGGAF